jgi:hypothetical protein
MGSGYSVEDGSLGNGRDLDERQLARAAHWTLVLFMIASLCGN